MLCRLFSGLFLLLISLQLVFAQHPLKLGRLNNPLLQEVSGIIPSVGIKDCYWVHNDSGDGAFLFLIDSLCNLSQIVELEGVNVVDVEDIAWLDVNGEPYVLLADMGNNLRNRDTLSLYLFKEPQSGQHIVKAADIRTVRFRYADRNRDAEALFVDPLDQHVYIISKRDFRSQVFSFSMFCDTAVHVLHPKLELPFTFVTAADIARDGKGILIKNLTKVYYWQRSKNQSVLSALKKSACEIPYIVEPQGEAICFDVVNHNFYTISERPFGLDSYLYKYLFF